MTALFFTHVCGDEPRDEEPAAEASCVAVQEPVSEVRIAAVKERGACRCVRIRRPTGRMFTVHDDAGEILDWNECSVCALETKRSLDAAEYVCNEAGEVIAIKLRIVGDHIFSAVWTRKAEPAWTP